MCNSTFLVFFETSGNQSYIFSTNKMKENIGASEVIYRVGTEFIIDAINKVFHTSLDYTAPHKIAQIIMDENINKPIELPESQWEIITATSGKALIMVKDEQKAKELITTWSLRVAKEAIGVHAKAVYTKFCFDSEYLSDAIKRVHELYEETRTSKGSGLLRDQNLPLLKYEDSSSLPAITENSGKELHSRLSSIKIEYRDKAVKRFKKMLQGLPVRIDYFIDSLTGDTENPEALKTIGIIHADINGLGKVFINLDKNINNERLENRDYIKRYRELSMGLEHVVIGALKRAIKDMVPAENKEDKNSDLPVIPIIVGGDDITLICRGKDALRLTKNILDAFEAEVENNPVVRKYAEEIYGVPRFGMSAGVAIVKHHFPFFTAYSLAEELTESAKVVKQRVLNKDHEPIPVCSMDFHVMYDTSVIQLDSIRDRYIQPGKKLTAKPYITTAIDKISDMVEDIEWAQAHRWELLEQAASILGNNSNNNENKGTAIPNSQAHELRKLLFFKPELAKKRFKFLKARYNFSWPHQGELFYKADNKELTLFVDALEIRNIY